MIASLSKEHPVEALCSLLGVARSGYYAWVERCGVTARQARDQEEAARIREIFEKSRGCYGSPRITAELRRRGYRCNHKKVERLMRRERLQGRRRKGARVRTTDSNHNHPIAPNLLRGRPAPTRINEVWVADLTYIRTAEGWLFLAGLMDLYSRQIIGWSIKEDLQTAGPLQALCRALSQRQPGQGVIHHSDQGVQYASHAYQEELRKRGLVQSMSRRGCCYDNAAIEAFWSTLKREALQESADWSKDRVRAKIFEYIESIYNRDRLHSGLGYRTPLEVAQPETYQSEKKTIMCVH